MKKEKTKPRDSVWKNTIYSVNSVWSYRKSYVILILVSVFVGFLGTFITNYAPAVVIDAVEKNSKVNTVALIITGVVLVSLIHGLISSCTENLRWTRRDKFQIYNQAQILKKAMRMDYSLLEDPDTVTVQNKAESAKRAMFDFLYALRKCVTQTLNFVVFGGILLSLHPLIVVLLFVSAALYFYFLRFLRNYQHKMKDVQAVTGRKMNYMKSVATDFGYAKEVRVYGMQKWINDLSKFFYGEHYKIESSVQWRAFWVGFAHSLLNLLRDGGAYIYLIWKISQGDISAAEFTFYFASIATVSNSITNFVQSLNEIKTQSLNVSDFRTYMEMPERYADYGTRIPDMDHPMEIELRDVSFTYPKAAEPTLRHINLKIRAGEKLAVVGVNGAGKTTLVKLLCGMYHPTEGEIYINGIPMRDYDVHAYYKAISAVFQKTQFLPVSIAANVGISDGTNFDEERVRSCVEMAGLSERIAMLPNGLSTYLGKDVRSDATDFSGGEMQKLMLARAIYKPSVLLVLDEPTAALDPIAENNMYMRYSGFSKDKTSVYISHRLSSTRFCDRIIFIENGTIAEEGTHSALMAKKGKYAEMFDVQSYYYKEKIGGEENEQK